MRKSIAARIAEAFNGTLTGEVLPIPFKAGDRPLGPITSPLVKPLLLILQEAGPSDVAFNGPDKSLGVRALQMLVQSELVRQYRSEANGPQSLAARYDGQEWVAVVENGQ